MAINSFLFVVLVVQSIGRSFSIFTDTMNLLRLVWICTKSVRYIVCVIRKCFRELYENAMRLTLSSHRK